MIINRCRYLFRKDISLGKKVSVHSSTFLGSPVKIGDYTNIGRNNLFTGRGMITIGKYCAFGNDIRIITSNHKMTKPGIQVKMYKELFGEDLRESRQVRIGNNVWIGDRVIILPGASIGDGAVVGAGSVVPKDIPPFSVAVGNPAKVKKKRFDEKTISKLKRMRWWDWSRKRMRKNRAFFMSDLEAQK
ncbi:MAG: CatB-related O-acetyltransferase [Candidatus Woesearchaeota archaeon]